MTPADAFALVAVGGAVWFWIDSMRVRERAIVLCRHLCRAHDVQLLDQTVALAKLGLARDRRGRVQIRRRYRFEFTRSGAERDIGTIMMLGSVMEAAEMPSA